MSNHELTKKISELKQLQRLVEEAESEIDAIKDDIKAYMDTQEVLIVGEYKVTWKPVKSVKFDSKAFKEQHSDLYQQFAKPTQSRRFCIA